jgi:hypothetical protein
MTRESEPPKVIDTNDLDALDDPTVECTDPFTMRSGLRKIENSTFYGETFSERFADPLSAALGNKVVKASLAAEHIDRRLRNFGNTAMSNLSYQTIYERYKKGIIDNVAVDEEDSTALSAALEARINPPSVDSDTDKPKEKPLSRKERRKRKLEERQEQKKQEEEEHRERGKTTELLHQQLDGLGLIRNAQIPNQQKLSELEAKRGRPTAPGVKPRRKKGQSKRKPITKKDVTGSAKDGKDRFKSAPKTHKTNGISQKAYKPKGRTKD